MSLPSDLPSLSAADWLLAAERRRVTAIATLLNHLPGESSAVITSADTLLTELFSHKGQSAASLFALLYHTRRATEWTCWFVRPLTKYPFMHTILHLLLSMLLS